ncbi:MAG: hypothetical protein ABL967_13530 [Bryobacteraceae bacterium]
MKVAGKFKLSRVLAIAVFALGLGSNLNAQSLFGFPFRSPLFMTPVGSWFGRAIPANTICPPGAPGCAVPPEIVMVFTVHGDGTFIGIDSNIFQGGSHSTAHGQWTYDLSGKMKATFTLLQSSPTGVFIGGFKNLFSATMVNPDRMEGEINAFLYLYADQNGRAIVDSDGLPTPSPLEDPSLCNPQQGCVPLGTFTFKAKRVNVQ